MNYVAIGHLDAPGIGFTIPALPGFAAHSESDDLDTALAEARDVLRDYLAAMADHGQEIPGADPAGELRAAMAASQGEGRFVALIPAILPAGRTVRVTLSLDEHALAEIDGKAEARKLTRSAFLVAAARAFD